MAATELFAGPHHVSEILIVWDFVEVVVIDPAAAAFIMKDIDEVALGNKNDLADSGWPCSSSSTRINMATSY